VNSNVGEKFSAWSKVVGENVSAFNNASRQKVSGSERSEWKEEGFDDDI
jgi:hypothetical protein